MGQHGGRWFGASAQGIVTHLQGTEGRDARLFDAGARASPSRISQPRRSGPLWPQRSQALTGAVDRSIWGGAPRLADLTSERTHVSMVTVLVGEVVVRSRVIVMWTAAAVVIAACSDEDRVEERVSVATAAARFECPPVRFGMACDPDPSGSSYGECDGLCTFDTSSPSGRTVCVRIAELGMPHLENYLCGDGPACTQTCNQAGVCVTAQALDGTACSEPGNGNKCARQCAAGSCQPITGEPCPQGRNSAGCGFQTCAPFAATQCVTVPYPTTTACSGGACDGCGVCSSSGPGACLDAGADASADAGALCGNGVVDALELCDLTDLGGETCESVTLGALPNGTLRCSPSCTFSLSGCSAEAGAGVGGAPGDGSAGAAGSGTSGAGGIAAGGAGGEGAAGTGAIDAGAGFGGTVAIDASAGAGGIDASAGSGGTVAIDASAGSGGSVGSDAAAGSGGLAAGGTGGLPAGGTGGLAAGGTGGLGAGGVGGAAGGGGADAGGTDGSAGFGGVEGGAGTGGVEGGGAEGGTDSGVDGDGAAGQAGSGGSSGVGGSAGLGGGTSGSAGTESAGTAGASGSAGSRSRSDGYVEGGGCDCRVGGSRMPWRASELGALSGLALVVSCWRRRRRR